MHRVKHQSLVSVKRLECNLFSIFLLCGVPGCENESKGSLLCRQAFSLVRRVPRPANKSYEMFVMMCESLVVLDSNDYGPPIAQCPLPIAQSRDFPFPIVNCMQDKIQHDNRQACFNIIVLSSLLN